MISPASGKSQMTHTFAILKSVTRLSNIKNAAEVEPADMPIKIISNDQRKIWRVKFKMALDNC